MFRVELCRIFYLSNLMGFYHTCVVCLSQHQAVWTWICGIPMLQVTEPNISNYMLLIFSLHRKRTTNKHYNDNHNEHLILRNIESRSTQRVKDNVIFDFINSIYQHLPHCLHRNWFEYMLLTTNADTKTTLYGRREKGEA